MKGYEKKVSFLKKIFLSKKYASDTDGNFEEVIFPVRGKDSPTRLGEGDMISEANRIIAESLNQSDADYKSERCGFSLKYLATFFLGAIFTAALFLTLKYIF